MGKPSIEPSKLSACAELSTLFLEKQLTNIGDGYAFTSDETAQLSSNVKSLSPRYSCKLYTSEPNKTIGRVIGGKIEIKGKPANALLFPRLDSGDIDFDLAVWLDNSSELSTVYHPTFNGRTTLSAEAKAALEVVCQMKNFRIPDLSSSAPILYRAFQCCESVGFVLK